MCASYPLCDKSFYIDRIHTIFGNKPKFSKTQLLYIGKSCCFSSILRMNNFQTYVGHCQLAEKRIHFSVSTEGFVALLNLGGVIKVSESKNRGGQDLNVILTMPKTKRHSQKPWISKLTQEEIIMKIRILLNI